MKMEMMTLEKYKKHVFVIVLKNIQKASLVARTLPR